MDVRRRKRLPAEPDLTASAVAVVERQQTVIPDELEHVKLDLLAKLYNVNFGTVWDVLMWAHRWPELLSLATLVDKNAYAHAVQQWQEEKENAARWRASAVREEARRIEAESCLPTGTGRGPFVGFVDQRVRFQIGGQFLDGVVRSIDRSTRITETPALSGSLVTREPTVWTVVLEEVDMAQT